jgi:purine-nucleoside phosphorylase
MAGAYDPGLRALAAEVAAVQGVELKEGVYAGVLGPAFETPAEVAALAGLGAHAVGMSTVLETIAARHMGVRVLGLSLVTNSAGSHDDGGHEAVLAAGEAGSQKMASLIAGIASALARVT